MNITADKLRSEWTSAVFIERHVKDIMVTIQNRILDAHRDSRTHIMYGAPVNFSVPEMSNEDASILVYHKIIKDLEKRGFKVVVEMHESETTLIISWGKSKGDRNLSNMVAYIASRRVDKAKRSGRKRANTRQHTVSFDPFNLRSKQHGGVDTPSTSTITHDMVGRSNQAEPSVHYAADHIPMFAKNKQTEPPPIPDMFKLGGGVSGSSASFGPSEPNTNTPTGLPGLSSVSARRARQPEPEQKIVGPVVSGDVQDAIDGEIDIGSTSGGKSLNYIYDYDDHLI